MEFEFEGPGEVDAACKRPTSLGPLAPVSMVQFRFRKRQICQIWRFGTAGFETGPALKPINCIAPLAIMMLKRALLFPHHPRRTDYSPLKSLLSLLMSHNHPTSTSSNFQSIFDNALKGYMKRTKKDLLKHPLADRIQACDSPISILTVLQEQVQEFNESQRSNERLTKWLDPTVNVLHVLSETLREGVGLVSIVT
jgi:hypothetical protein